MTLAKLTKKALIIATTGGAWLTSTGTALAATLGQSANPEGNLPFLFGVYAVTWGAFFAFAFYMTRRQRSLKQEIEDLRNDLTRQRQLPQG